MRWLILAGAFAVACGLTGNEYIDNVLQFRLPDHMYDSQALHNFVDKMNIPGTGPAVVDFTTGKVTGLTSVQRIGNCAGPRDVGYHLSLNCTLSFRNLMVTFDAHARIVRLGRFLAQGRATNAHITLGIKSFRNSRRPDVNTMEVHGLTLGPAKDAFHSAVLDTLNKYENAGYGLRYTLEVYFKTALQKSLEEYPLPLPRELFSSGDEYVDFILQDVTGNIGEGYYLPDMFNRLHIGGQGILPVEFINGRLTGLNRIGRHEPCSDPISLGYNVSFTCNLDYEDLKVIYDGKIRRESEPNMLFGLSPFEPSITSSLRVKVAVTVSSHRHSNYPLVKEAKIQELTFGPPNDVIHSIIIDSWRNHDALITALRHDTTKDLVNAFQKAMVGHPLPLPQ